MNKNLLVRLVGIVLVLVAAACVCQDGGVVYELSANKISIADVTETPTPTPTPTSTPLPTATPMPSNTPLPTETLLPTGIPTPVVVVITTTPTLTSAPTATVTPFEAIVSGNAQLLYSAPKSSKVVRSIDSGTHVLVLERLRYGKDAWIRVQLLTGEIYVMRIEALAPINFEWEDIPISEN